MTVYKRGNQKKFFEGFDSTLGLNIRLSRATPCLKGFHVSAGVSGHGERIVKNRTTDEICEEFHLMF